MSTTAIQPLFAPRLSRAGEFLLGITHDEARWFRVINISSVGVDDREVTFRVNEDENAISYVAGRMPNAEGAERELYDLIEILETSAKQEEEN